jgi:hypothetical protein
MHFASLLSRLIFFMGGLFLVFIGIACGNAAIAAILPAFGLFFMAKGLWLAAILGTS